MGIFTLAISGKSEQDSTISKFALPNGKTTRRNSLDELKRIDPKRIELIFGRDPIGFNMCNTLTDMILVGEPSIENLFQHKNKKIKDYYVNFFKNIGNIGEPITLEDLFDGIFKNLFIHGNSFVQILWNKKKEVNDVSLIDPKRIDYLKDSSKKVILDEDNIPVGYVIKKAYGNQVIGDKIPKKYLRSFTNMTDSYFLLSERIVHFKINAVGDRFWGIGILEPAYSSVLRKMNIEEGQANSVYKNAFNPLIGYVGSDRKVATPKDLSWVSKLLSELDVTKVGAFPDWVKVDTLRYEQSPIVTATLEYQRENQISPAGLPMAIASGKADTTNKSTLGIHLQLNQFKLRRIVKSVLATFEKYILKKIAYYNKVKGIPTMTWGSVGPIDKERVVDRIIDCVDKGIFTKEEVRDKLKQELNL